MIMIDLRKIIGPDLRGRIMYALSFLPDKLYLRLFYFATTGRMLHFRNPRGYNEKLQWIKIYDRHPEHSKLVDKVAVREHIKEVWGEEHLFPLLGYWECFDEIDFSVLPNQFVLKCNHDSGSTKVIRDKASLTREDMDALRKHFTNRLKHDFYYAGREYPYKGLKRYILAEACMVDERNPDKSIEDYKFYCFNGEPKIMLVVSDRATNCRFDFFDMDFIRLDIVRSKPNSSIPPQKPEKFEEMKKVASELCEGIRHVRIDMYELNGKLYFGEYTFFPGGGFQLFHPEEWEQRLGDWIE